MNTTECLRQLGVTPDLLSAQEKATLDREGYIVFPALLPADLTRRIAERIEAIAAAEGEAAGRDFQVEAGATRLGTLINKDPIFDICFQHPKMLATVHHIMGDDMGLSTVTSRSAKPGEGHQGLHRDGPWPRSANALWLISDFTPDNGPTRLIPRSHRWPKGPAEGMADPAAAHPDQIPLLAPAGSLAIIYCQLWHGGTANTTDKPRHCIHTFWLPHGEYQTEANRRLTPQAFHRLSPASRQVIDFLPPEPAPEPAAARA